MVAESCCAPALSGIRCAPARLLSGRALLRLEKRRSFLRDSERLDQLRPVIPNVPGSLGLSRKVAKTGTGFWILAFLAVHGASEMPLFNSASKVGTRGSNVQDEGSVPCIRSAVAGSRVLQSASALGSIRSGYTWPSIHPYAISYACRSQNNSAPAAGCGRRSDPATGLPGASFEPLSRVRQHR